MMLPSLPDKKNSKIQKIIIGILCLVCLLQTAGFQTAAAAPRAQSPVGEWSLPVNISQSGSSFDPTIVTDKSGNNHVVWFDEFSGSRYARSQEDGTWSEPISVVYPFGTYRPTLMRGPRENLLAFWRDRNNELFTSRVLAENFGNGWAWAKSKSLAQRALAYDAAVDEDGIIHLVYLNQRETIKNPSGIYYRHTFADGDNWSADRLIYPSLYLRGVEPDQLNISIAVRQDSVYVAWDENPLSKVYFSMSPDKGATWTSPFEVDSTGEGTGSTVPFGIDVAAWNDQTMLVWKEGSAGTGGSCAIRYQASEDQGKTWEMQGSMPTTLASCPTSGVFVDTQTEALYWQTNINNQIALVAWDGKHWSEPQIQTELSSATDPVTNSPINSNCWKFTSTPNLNRLMAVGCDDEGNRDIWFSSKALGDLDNWFPPASAWKKAEPLFETPAEVSGLTLLTDSESKFHGFWLQPSDGAAEGAAGPPVVDAVFYTSSDGDGFSSPVPIAKNPRGGARNLSVFLSADDQLFVVWQGDQTGEIYFTWSAAERASIAAEWSDPLALPQPVKIGVSPTVTVWRGIIYVAYAIPINERRGIYITRSADLGKTWTQPVQVFDGQAAGWEMVGSPSLAITPDDQLHATWVRESLPGTRGSQGLYYARSTDYGENWTEAQAVMEESITWGKAVVTNSGGLYQLWQDAANQNIVRSRTSINQGESWAPAEALAGAGEPVGPSSVFADPSGKLYLMRFFADRPTNLTLQNWENKGGIWTAGEQHSLAREPGGQVTNLAAAISRNGLLGVLYAETKKDPESGELVHTFTFTSRPVDMPEVLPTQPAPMQDPGMAQVTVTVTAASVAPTATPTPPLITEPGQELPDTPAPSDNTMTGLIVSIGLSGLLVAIGFAVVLFRKRIR